MYEEETEQQVKDWLETQFSEWTWEGPNELDRHFQYAVQLVGRYSDRVGEFRITLNGQCTSSGGGHPPVYFWEVILSIGHDEVLTRSEGGPLEAGPKVVGLLMGFANQIGRSHLINPKTWT